MLRLAIAGLVALAGTAHGDECKRERRRALDSAERLVDPAERARALAAISPCAKPPKPPAIKVPAPWMFDVRIGKAGTGTWESESDTPHGNGGYLEFEAGPRPDLGFSLTGFASYTRFSDVHSAASYSFVDAGVRGNVHLSWLRFGGGLGMSAINARTAAWMTQVFTGLDVPIGMDFKLTVLAILSMTSQHSLGDGWISARLAAGISF